MKLSTSCKLVSTALISFLSLSKATKEVVVVNRLRQNVIETQEEQHPHRRLQLELNQRWKDRIGDVVIVPYAIASTYDAAEVETIQSAILDLSSRIRVVQFVPRTTQRAYIEVVNDGMGCSTVVGRHPSGTVQRLNLQRDGCVSRGTIQHEFLHAVCVCERHCEY